MPSSGTLLLSTFGGDCREKRAAPNCRLGERRLPRIVGMGALFCKDIQGHSGRTDSTCSRDVNAAKRWGRLVYKTKSGSWSYLGCCRKCSHLCFVRLNRGNDPATPPPCSLGDTDSAVFRQQPLEKPLMRRSLGREVTLD